MIAKVLTQVRETTSEVSFCPFPSSLLPLLLPHISFLTIPFPPHSLTGRLVRFACDITESWCARNNIQLIIRSHEYNPSGFLVMHNGRVITVFSARNYMDAVLNDSALLLLTYDDTKSLRVRIKTLAQKYIPPVASVASPMNTSDEATICEQFGKIRPHSNLLDAILIPEAPQELNITAAAAAAADTGGTDAGGGGGGEATEGVEEDESEIEAIQIDYSSNLVLCSSQTNLNDILRETNQKYDKKLLKTLTKRSEKKKKSSKSQSHKKMSSFDSEGEEEEEEGDEDEDEDENNLSTIDERKKSKSTSFVKRLRNSVKEIFSRSSSKEMSSK
jgi:hypothetical protein